MLYLKSERILELAAKQLDNQKPFQVEPPASEGERVGFLKSRFAVAREKEPGSNTMSNIVQLTFKSPHPADSPKYLRAIIEAYRDDLDTVYAGRVEGSARRTGTRDQGVEEAAWRQSTRS